MKRYIVPLLMLCLVALTASAQKSKDHNFEVGKHLDIFNQVYKNLELLYVDTLNPKETIGTGINAMLRSLDPYTEYYAQDETKNLRMMLTGKYAGIGALIRKHQKLDRIVVDEPYANMPAAESGLKKGDVILSIDDSMMTDKSVSYVSEHLRGEAGTSFLLKVMRPSTGKLMSFKITRRNIKLPEMPYYGIQDGNVGYINLNSFTEGCSKEVRRALIDLKKQGATSLVLDLRGNGGGSEQEAVDILNLWLTPIGFARSPRERSRNRRRSTTVRTSPRRMGSSARGFLVLSTITSAAVGSTAGSNTRGWFAIDAGSSSRPARFAVSGWDISIWPRRWSISGSSRRLRVVWRASCR